MAEGISFHLIWKKNNQDFWLDIAQYVAPQGAPMLDPHHASLEERLLAGIFKR